MLPSLCQTLQGQNWVTEMFLQLKERTSIFVSEPIQKLTTVICFAVPTDGLYAASDDRPVILHILCGDGAYPRHRPVLWAGSWESRHHYCQFVFSLPLAIYLRTPSQGTRVHTHIKSSLCAFDVWYILIFNTCLTAYFSLFLFWLCTCILPELCVWIHTLLSDAESWRFERLCCVFLLFLYVLKSCIAVDVFVCSVCIQIKVLTELGAFTQAVKELSNLTFGVEIPVPHGCHHRVEKPSWVKHHKQYRIYLAYIYLDKNNTCNYLLYSEVLSCLVLKKELIWSKTHFLFIFKTFLFLFLFHHFMLFT